MLIRDFKKIISASEKIEGGLGVVRKCIQFGKWAQKYGLIDIYSFSPKFTLRGQESKGYNRVFKKLDRGFGNHS